ncbi:acyl transferase/acyl hydrolase/lysophospholipase [Rhodofomes roseus]|uniref:Acyl transferase/acyl hydrolase/lysophospholipase n=1 Tax=Rhodofomes roseus TaxID=34475 RepID=A0ABQ8KCR1_9APHY|nr:acyl transferase/acyl hydrolase/lysophospholipase [Rhodofomes roseus]KAH9835281.1 acyl transferase/acyl hydrolase/lysophospholipase [Rhodofomes roseus]
MSKRVLLAQSTSEGVACGVEKKLWFKTKPLDHDFCRRAIQLQLWTDSHDDQGSQDAPNHALCTWFELCILEDKHATQPVVKDGKELVWTSHFNVLHSHRRIARHFGIIFDRRREILNEVGIGNCIGVRICAQHVLSRNFASGGTLTANVLKKVDLVSPTLWTLCTSNTPIMPKHILNGVYTVTVTATHACLVEAADAKVYSRTWFTTPAFNADLLNRIRDLRLYTSARQQGSAGFPPANQCSWFDIAVLEKPDSKHPKIMNGRELVWVSHHLNTEHVDCANDEGRLFTRADNLFSFLQSGNAIGVRVCARFEGSQNHAKEGRLVVHVSNKSYKKRLRTEFQPTVDWNIVTRTNKDIRNQLLSTLPDDTQSTEAEVLAQRLRIDQGYGVAGRPLRLLSLDGGGVRGISSLHILQRLFRGDENARPCEVFDMMAGTSTGGLIAIMLGRLRMTIGQCIDVYQKLSREIFGATSITQTTNMLKSGTKYNARIFENAVKKVVEDYFELNNPEEVQSHSQNLNNKRVTHLRTYDNPEVNPSLADYKIWEAARATTAAPVYFAPIELDGYKYMDGGFGYNNPVLQLITESRLCFGPARQVCCLVSIGTGGNPDIAFPKGVTWLFKPTSVKNNLRLLSLPTSSSSQHYEAGLLCGPGAYHRFDMGELVSEQDWDVKVR